MDARGIEPKERAPASRKLGRDDAAELAAGADHLVVAKGRKIREWRGTEIDAEAIAAMLGPTGNLRAPTARAGNTILVGYDESAWADSLS